MFKTIIELLAHQECVIVPGFGGFVVNDHLAEIRDGKFMPPRKELVFNSRLVHNDGDLAHAIMGVKSCSFEEATQFISSEVSNIWFALKNDGVFMVPDFGVFTLKSGKVSFLQKNLGVASDESFGLDDFFFPVLDKNDPRALVNNPSRITSGGSAKTALIAVAAVLAFLLVGQPVQDVSQPNMASLLPNITNSQSSIANELEVKKAELNQVQSELEAYKGADADFYLITADFSDEESAYDYMHKNGLCSSLLCIRQHYYLTVFSAKTKEAVDSFCLSNESTDWSDAYILSVSKFNDELE